jgi:hypothetical protein
MIRLPTFWCLVLVAACVVVPYLFRVPPRRRRDWMLLTAAIAFLMWLLGGFAAVRGWRN